MVSGWKDGKKQVKLKSWEPGKRKVRTKGERWGKSLARACKLDRDTQTSFVLVFGLTQDRRDY